MKRLIMFALVVALVGAAPAYGQNSLKDESGGPAASISTLSQHNSRSASSGKDPSGNGTLPFTGFDVVLLALGGVALVGVGMGVRRLSRPLA